MPTTTLSLSKDSITIPAMVKQFVDLLEGALGGCPAMIRFGFQGTVSVFRFADRQSGVVAAALHIATAPASARDSVVLTRFSLVGIMPRRGEAPPAGAAGAFWSAAATTPLWLAVASSPMTSEEQLPRPAIPIPQEHGVPHETPWPPVDSFGRLPSV